MSEKLKNIALISAAGAGKTRALTRRFLFLYLNRANYSLDSLYGITFTNEAAFEMKERILNYLNLLIAGSVDDESEKDIIHCFSNIFPDIKERAKKKKRYLLNNLSDLNISTFHSLFASFLSGIPFAAGILPGYEIIDEMQEKIIFDSVVDQFFDDVYRNKDLFKIISELVEQEETSLKRSLTTIFTDIMPWLDFLERLVKEENKIKVRLVREKRNFSTILKLFRNFVHEHESCTYVKNSKSMNKYFANFLAKIDDYIDTDDVNILHGLIFGTDLPAKSYIKSFLNNCGEDAEPFLKILGEMEIHTKKLLKALSDQQILIHLKPILKVYQQYQRAKQERNMLSFNDIETYTLQALKNNPEPDYLYFRIGCEMRHLMIDEFQDTSHRQLEILEPLIAEIISVAPTEKSIFYVGDPYQAIFRWRGGSPALFRLLATRYPGKIEEDKLVTNYRSKEEIIDFVNVILDKNDRAKPGNTGGWIRVEHLGIFDGKEKGEVAVREKVIETIKEMHESYGYEYSDIAILVRTNNFGALMAETLTKNGVPNVSRSRAVILDNNDVRFILNLLRFLNDPEDDFALMHVLLSPVFSVKEKTLMHLRSKQKTLFINLCTMHPGWGITKSLKKLLSIVHFCNPYELVYRIYKELGLRLSYALATLLDVALNYTRDGYNSLSSFIGWLENAGKAIEVKEIHPEGVKILTIHKAKGLEFEVVIIPETNWKSSRYENRQLLFSYEEGGAKPAGIYWRSYGKYFEDLKIAEQERLRMDDLNLLYVALTRAKNGIYIFGFDRPKGGAGFWVDTIAEKTKSKDCSIGEIAIKQRPKIKTIKEETYGQISEEPLVIRDERGLYSPTERGVEIVDTARRRSMEFGTMLHQALNRIGWLDNIEVNDLVDEVIFYIKNIYVHVREDANEIDARLRPLLVETITDPDLKFLFFRGSQKIEYKNELPIYFEEKKSDISSHIDRVLIEPNRIIIVDYKTGDEKSEYVRQMHIYKKGIGKIYQGRPIKTLLVYVDKERGKKIVEV